MEEFFQIGKNDRLPSLKIKATTRINGQRVPLPGLAIGQTCTFFMRVEGGGTLKINGAAATVEDDINGILRYDWAAGDTDTPGHYDGEFKVVINGKTVTIPNDEDRKINIWVTEDVS